MTKEEDFKLLKIQTCVLKVSIHCDGCKQKVKKLLQRIEGVYQVNIDADQQKVTVSGTVDSSTLIKKLIRAGKHAEVWSHQKSSQNQKIKNNVNCIKDDKKNSKGQKQSLNNKGVQAFKNQQQKLPAAFSSEEEDDDDYFDDEEYEDDYEDELRFLEGTQLGLLRQQAINNANNAKKNMGAMAAAASNNGNKMANNLGNGNAGKKGNPNQNMGIKVNPVVGGGVIDPKTMAALRMNNGVIGGGNINAAGEGKRGNDIAAMMNLAGFHGNGANVASSAAALGGNPNSLGGYQGSSASSGFPSGGGGYVTGQQHPSSMLINMNGYNHPASMMVNMQNKNVIQQQPQMMYHRSPIIPPSTGYYYYNNNNSYTTPAPYPPYTERPNYSNVVDHSTAAATTTSHMFSDENTSSCSIM